MASPHRSSHALPHPAPVIRFEDVGVVRGGVAVLSGISWEVAPGQHWAVVGANGSGKTTLLQVVAGYDHPTTGRVQVLGCELGHTDVRFLRRSIGWVSPALARRLRPGDSARDVVVSGRFASIGLFFEDPQPDEFQRADELLDTLGCSHLGDRSFGVLSQGEQQRVLVARALMPDPRILVLDEPTSALDIAAREDFLAALEVLTGAPDGPVVLMVSHHLEEVVPGITHALLLKGGSPVAAGPAGAVLTGPHVSDAMGVPVEVLRRDGRFWALVSSR